MRIKLVCVGKAKGPAAELSGDYAARIRAFAQLSVIEIPEVRYVKEPPPGERDRILAEEGARIEAKLDAREYLVVLDERGRRFTSEEFAAHLEERASRGVSDSAFVIGGSLGLSPAVKARADLALSLSTFTLPHQLARIVFLEQLYRALTIIRGTPYHK